MDEVYMKEALKEAQLAFDKGEVPVGAVIVFQNQIVARAHNQVETLQDATAHAETLCIRAASEYFNNWRLLETTLYCTLEPCALCAGGMMLARVPRLVWGAPDLRHGADGSLFDILRKPHPIHQVEAVRGVLQEECAALLKEFFRERRIEKSIR